MPEEINHHRRGLLGVAALGFAAAELGMSGSAHAQSGNAAATTIKPGANNSFGSLKQIDAGVLNVGYAEAGPADGPAGHSPARLALRHSHLCRCRAVACRDGLPGDRSASCADTARRASSPDETIRNGQQSAIAVDVIALMDALKIDKAILGGCDWGARTAEHRRRALAGALQGPGLGERLSDRQPRDQQDAVAAEGRTAMVVPVLLRDRTRPGRLRQIPARFRQAHLAARFAEMGLRRRHVRSQRGGLRQSGPCRHRDP